MTGQRDAFRSTVHPASRRSSPKLGGGSRQGHQGATLGAWPREEGALQGHAPGRGNILCAGPDPRQAWDFAPAWPRWPPSSVPSLPLPLLTPLSDHRHVVPRPAHKFQPQGAAFGCLPQPHRHLLWVRGLAPLRGPCSPQPVALSTEVSGCRQPREQPEPFPQSLGQGRCPTRPGGP